MLSALLDEIDFLHTEDFLDPVLYMKKMKETNGAAEFHEEIKIAFRSRLASRDGPE